MDPRVENHYQLAHTPGWPGGHAQAASTAGRARDASRPDPGPPQKSGGGEAAHVRRPARGGRARSRQLPWLGRNGGRARRVRGVRFSDGPRCRFGGVDGETMAQGSRPWLFACPSRGALGCGWPQHAGRHLLSPRRRRLTEFLVTLYRLGPRPRLRAGRTRRGLAVPPASADPVRATRHRSRSSPQTMGGVERLKRTTIEIPWKFTLLVSSLPAVRAGSPRAAPLLSFFTIVGLA